MAETLQMRGIVRVRAFDAEQLANHFSQWPSLPKWAKLYGVNNGLGGKEPPDPIHEETVENVTTSLLGEAIVDFLDNEQANPAVEASHLAVGDDAESGTTSGDTSLNNEQYRAAVTDSVDNGRDLTTSTFFDSSEANGVAIDEVGLFDAASGGTMLNHATISEVVKDSTLTVTIDVELQFRSN